MLFNMVDQKNHLREMYDTFCHTAIKSLSIKSLFQSTIIRNSTMQNW